MIVLIEQRRPQLTALCRKYQVARLDVFGSAAERHGVADVRNIDFLVTFHAAPDMGPADQYFGLLADLEVLFARPIDLVCLDAMQNPYFIREVERSRSPLYAA